MLKLYFSPGSCSQASHIALEEAGAVYEAQSIDFSNQQQRSADFLRINHKGRVPALVTDKGILTESPAILAYIGQSFPDTPIGVPVDPFEFARIQAFNAYLCSTVHVAHAHKRRGSRWADQQSSLDDMAAKMPQNMRDGFQIIENDLLQGPFVLGEAYSVADAYLFVMSDWLEGVGIDLAEFPNVQDHYRRVRQRPAVIRALEEQEIA